MTTPTIIAAPIIPPTIGQGTGVCVGVVGAGGVGGAPAPIPATGVVAAGGVGANTCTGAGSAGGAPAPVPGAGCTSNPLEIPILPEVAPVKKILCPV